MPSSLYRLWYLSRVFLLTLVYSVQSHQLAGMPDSSHQTVSLHSGLKDALQSLLHIKALLCKDSFLQLELQ